MKFAYLLPLCLFWAFFNAFGYAAPLRSQNPTESPDKTKNFQVERLSDYSDPFSGKMLLRLTEINNPANTHQRIVEGTRVRTMTQPKWLDTNWVGYSYNVAKNTVGYCFYNSVNHETLLVEADIVSLMMGTTGKEEFEMQSMVLTQYTDRKAANLQMQNLTWGEGNRSLFPLYLPSSKELTHNDLPGIEFVNELKQGLSSYRELCSSKKAHIIIPELGTETFDSRNGMCAFLGAMDTTPTLIILPLNAKKASDAFAQAKLVELPQTVKLSATAQDDSPDSSDTSEQDAQHDELTDSRFTTKLGTGGTFVVAREVYDEAQQNTHLLPFAEVDTKGNIVFVPQPKQADQTSTPTVSE